MKKIINIFYRKSKEFNILIISFFLFLTFASSSIINAQSTNNLDPLTTAEKQAVLKALKDPNNTCPEPIKRKIIDSLEPPAGGTPAEIYGRGTLTVATENGQPVALNCANIGSLQKLVIRLFMLLFSVLGIVFAFSFIRGGILMMTSFTNKDQFQKGLESIVRTVGYTIGTIASYSVFVFVVVGVLGIGTQADKPEYNLFCQNQIIFNLAFDDAKPC